MQSAVTVVVQRTVAVLNFIIAVVSGFLLLVSILIALSHPFSAGGVVGFIAEILLNFGFILGLLYLGIRLWHADLAVLRMALWFFGAESLYFLIGFALSFAGLHREFWLPFGIGNLAFVPQFMTVYPVSAGAALASTYVTSRRSKKERTAA